MQSKPISEYIYFGTSLRFLQDSKEGSLVHEDGWILHNLRAFFSQLEEFSLPVTLRASNKLQKLMEELQKTQPAWVLSGDQADRLSRTIDYVRETLFAEAAGNVAFIATDKRIDVNKLLNDMRALMAPKVFDALPEIAQHDFGESGKCIAFELPTAAAFHALRGTEAVLRQYYCSLVQKGRSQLMWGPMIISLRKRRVPPPAPLLDNLDNIRRNFRNPTQHPEKIYDIEEVQDLFALCIDVVNRMASSSQYRLPL